MTAAIGFGLGLVVAVGIYGAVQHARMNRRVRWVEGEMRKMQRPRLSLVRGGKK